MGRPYREPLAIADVHIHEHAELSAPRLEPSRVLLSDTGGHAG